MLKVNNCTIELAFDFQHIDHRIMKVAVVKNNKTIQVEPVYKNDRYTATTKFDIKLPTIVTLEFSGKNHNTDTKVDGEGNVLQDVCVNIKSLRLDGFLIDQNFLQQNLKLIATDNSVWLGQYVGFNGVMKIELTQDNIFSQLIECARK